MEECMKKQSLALFLVFLGFVSLNAATVSVLVVETGLPPGNGCTPSAGLWESGFMDALFDAGHIVSNAPCMQIAAAFDANADIVSRTLPREVNSDFDQARIGGADFFVLVILDYKEGTGDHPKNVLIRVFNVASGEMLQETKIVPGVWKNTDEEFLDVKKQAGKILPRLIKKG